MLSFQMGKVKVYIWFSFFAVICLFLAIGQNPWGLWCISASILHELGHLAAFLYKGYPPLELHFEYSGIRLIPQKQIYPMRQEIFFLASGSAVNLFCFFTLWLLKLPVPAFFHLVLGVFNLFPLKGLDGGQILKLLLERLLGPRPGEMLSTAVSWIADILLVSGGLGLFRQTGNFTLLLTVLYFFFLGFSTKEKNFTG